MSFPCPLCDYTFTQKSKLENHLSRKKPCTPDPSEDQLKLYREAIDKYKLQIGRTFKCRQCDYESYRKDLIISHQESGACPQIYTDNSDSDNNDTSAITKCAKVSNKSIITPMKKPNQNISTELDEFKQTISTEFNEFKQKILSLQNQQRITNHHNTINNNDFHNHNNVNVVCIDSTDNLLRLLDCSMGRKKAIQFVKDKALVLDVTSDCYILECAYMTDSEGDAIDIPPVRFTNNKCNEVEYESKTGHKIESLATFMEMLANLLKDCYSQTMVCIENLKKKGNKDIPLDTYEITQWSKHQNNLMDNKYLKKLANQTQLIAKPTKFKVAK